MLRQISWHTYLLSITGCLAAYYLYVALVYYKTEIVTVFRRLSGNPPARGASGAYLVPAYPVMGAAQQEEVQFIAPEELVFGLSDHPDEAETMPGQAAGSDAGSLAGEFAEMIQEVKTLIRVIADSREPRENFQMLFGLIVQKYPSLQGSPYQRQVNDFLLRESAGLFLFELNSAELESIWNGH